MRKPVLASFALTVACVLAFAACGSSGKSSSGGGQAPVALSGRLNNHGMKDVSAQAAPTIEIEADDFYFNPTFIKAKPGTTVTVELKNGAPFRSI